MMWAQMVKHLFASSPRSAAPVACALHSGVASTPPPPLKVAVDLSFGSLMLPVERRSIAKQLNRCYGHNNKAGLPLDLHFTALNEARLQYPESLPQALDVWKHCTRVGAPAADHWQSDEIVWLSPDADEPLLEIDPASVYVIGGFVDRTIKPGVTKRLAQSSSARCQRLPLREFASRSDVHPVLSILAVVQILEAMHSGSSWQDAMTTYVPGRFVKRREREEQKREERRRELEVQQRQSEEPHESSTRAAGTGSEVI
jgi:tRNA (guanine9-N1)-methyltransferase